MELRASRPQTDAEFEAYYDLRWRVLRKPWGQGREMARDELEDLAAHAMVSDEQGCLVGVGRIHLVDAQTAQVRFMGVAEGRREMGVGRALLAYLEEAAVALGATRIILHSRSNVVGFYHKLGYRVVGEGPTYFEHVTHFRMEKELS